MKLKFTVFLSIVGAFLLGATIWVIKQKIHPLNQPTTFTQKQDAQTQPALAEGILSWGKLDAHRGLVKVEDEEINKAEIDFEYWLYSQSLKNTDEMTPIPALDKDEELDLQSLRHKLLTDVIERKTLLKISF